MEKEIMLMEPNTGAVDTQKNWLRDYELYAKEEGEDAMDFEEWGGFSLIEVKKDADGSWVEA